MNSLVLVAFAVGLACGLEVTELNGTLVMHVDSVNFVLANNSFSFTAPVLVVPSPGTFAVGPEGAGMLLLINMLAGAASNAIQWARACEAVGCAGIVYYNLADYNSAVEYSWVYRTGSTIPFTKVPIVLIHAKSGATAIPYLLSRQTPFAMTVKSGDYNEGSSFVDPICYIFYAPCFFISLLNVVLVISQLSRFLVSENGTLRWIPKYPLMAMSTEFVATMMRCIYFGNALFSKSQGIEFSVWRYTTLACISWAFMGTAIVAFGLHDMLFVGHPGGMPRKHRIATLIMAVLLIGSFVFEELCNIMPAFFYVHIIDNVTYFALLYFLLYLPICFCFIKYGRKISTTLLQMKGSISKTEANKRKRFARRVVQSGILGLIVDLVMLLVTLTNAMSVTISIVGYTIDVMLMSLCGALHVLSFVPGPSKMDVLANSLISASFWTSSIRGDRKSGGSHNIPNLASPQTPIVVKATARPGAGIRPV